MKDFYRNVDQLGRIVLPKEIRTVNSINEGDALSVRVTKEGILLTPSKSVCALCGSRKKLVSRGGDTLCRDCITVFMQALEGQVEQK